MWYVFDVTFSLQFAHTPSLIKAFELLTAEYLFDPQGQGELFTKDDDHMAQIIELVGDFPLKAKMGGKSSRELFDHTGMSPSSEDYQSVIVIGDCRCTAIYPYSETVASQESHDGEVFLF